MGLDVNLDLCGFRLGCRGLWLWLGLHNWSRLYLRFLNLFITPIIAVIVRFRFYRLWLDIGFFLVGFLN